MLDTPEAAPTWSSGTHAVDAAEAGPLDRPIPTAMATSGTTNRAYRHDESTRPTAAKPAEVTRKPSATTWRPPNLVASFGTIGAITTRPTVAGRVASPASSGVKSRVLGFWKYRLRT